MGTAELPGSQGRQALLVTIIAAGLALRLYMCFFSGLSNVSTDTIDYITMADAILRGTPISNFPNGFPLIIAAAKGIVGSLHVHTVLLLLNVALSVGTLVLTYEIALALYGANAALAAAAILAVWPNQLNYTRLILSEVPAEFFLILGVYLLVYEKPVMSGASLYLSGFIRATLLPVAPLAIILLVWRSRLKTALLLAAGFASILAVDYILKQSNVIRAPSILGRDLLKAIGSTSTDFSESLEGFSEYQRAHPIITYIDFAAQHPLTFLHQRLSALWELWGPWPNKGDVDHPRTALSRLLIGLRFPVFLLAIFSAFRQRGTEAVAVAGIPLLVITAIHVMFYGNSRFTYPVEPLAIILSVGASGAARRAPIRLQRAPPDGFVVLTDVDDKSIKRHRQAPSE